ncbi:ligand-gated ion channel [Methanofollis fontis]|uniref:Neurotransmitter-gated ion-channel ligand-binding domain-containing protein n=1 Tax=Methanofollis fontis TaxID=2052832 RepID=A0A483CWB6_9EURY|nr:hypothetical protein [Methanofollis fontis]TAJ45470.1 hypothetical protein CUJ86_01695 [Methanofollis fontis]
MIRFWRGKHRPRTTERQAACLIFILLLLSVSIPAAAQIQESGSVQVLTERLETGETAFYDLAGLREGQDIYIHATGTSGNLDPFIAIAHPTIDREQMAADFVAGVEEAVSGGGDPLGVIPRIADRYFLAWDDDGGAGYAAALHFRVPADGDYVLDVMASPAREETFGDYRLTIGIDAPGVLDGTAGPTGSTIAVLDREASRLDMAVGEVAGTLTPEKTGTYHILGPVRQGDILYARVERTSGDLIPVIVLQDNGEKILAAGIATDGGGRASFTYTFTEATENSRIEVSGQERGGNATAGAYRLLVGINDPSVLGGAAEPHGGAVLIAPLLVAVGVEMDQITVVDQQAENFGVVANLWMQWNDPALAYSPDTCDCRIKIYREIDDFVAAEGTRWPEFTLYNQQGNRWTQNSLISIQPDGTATYYERFWVILQAPDFDFKNYPFDTQDFYIRVDSIYPEEAVFYTPWEEKTAVGTQLGEEEWYITGSDSGIGSIMITGINSRYSFHFTAQRHLTYYILRILVPILLIIVLSWIPFLLRDYGKRADIAGANLLLFIAFNFTIANDLPRLGYLTFLDSILVTTFMISGATVAYNLYLKWLATERQKEIAERIDRIIVWLYPLGYILAIALILIFFP